MSNFEPCPEPLPGVKALPPDLDNPSGAHYATPDVTKKDNNGNKVEFEASSHNIRSKRIDVRGEVDVNSAPILLDQIRAAIDRRPEVIIINLGHVTRMDSAGVAVLIEGINEARKEKIILSLQDVSKPVQQVLEMARVDKLFQVSGKNYLPPQR